MAEDGDDVNICDEDIDEIEDPDCGMYFNLYYSTFLITYVTDLDGIPIFGDAWEEKEVNDVANFNQEVQKLGQWSICAVCGRKRLQWLFVQEKIPLDHPKVQSLYRDNEPQMVNEGISDNCANVCIECWNDLKKREPLLPQFAKINGMNFGTIPPELSCLNRMEIGMISRVIPLVQVIYLRGGQLATSRNCIAFKRKVLDVVNRLPRAPRDTGIVYVKSPSSQRGVYGRYAVRPKHVREALDWLMQNNYRYRTIVIDEPLLQEFELNAEMETEEIDANIADRLRMTSFEPVDGEQGNIDGIDHVFVHVPDSDSLQDTLPVCFIYINSNITNFFFI